MLNFLRRVNRGVVLAIVLVVGLSAFFVVDNSRFKKEIPEIEELIEEYLQACAEISITDRKSTRLNSSH